MRAFRFCHKCAAMFFDGRPKKGPCAAGGSHEAQGLEFILARDEPETAQGQANWRLCRKCFGVAFDGFAEKGSCPGGGAHDKWPDANFMLPHDIPVSPVHQSQWRYCHKCFVLFFDGFPDKGQCAAGGAHEAQGLTFVPRTTAQIID